MNPFVTSSSIGSGPLDARVAAFVASADLLVHDATALLDVALSAPTGREIVRLELARVVDVRGVGLRSVA
jgi:hypothetical protein